MAPPEPDRTAKMVRETDLASKVSLLSLHETDSRRIRPLSADACSLLSRSRPRVVYRSWRSRFSPGGVNQSELNYQSVPTVRINWPHQTITVREMYFGTRE